MKKFLLIVNTTVLLFLFSSVLLPPKIKAQNQSVLAAQTQSDSTPITLLRDLLKILFSFNTAQPPPPASQPQPPPPQNPLTPILNPSLPPSISIFPSPISTSGPLPSIPPGKMGSILQWTIAISDRLEGENVIWPPSVYYNRLLKPPTNGSYTAAYTPATSLSNLYWCTYLVADAYNLAGIKGLSRSSHATVKNMQQFFISTPNYSYIPFSVKFINYYSSPPSFKLTSSQERKQAMSTVQSGCATFFQKTPGVHVPYGNHVAILKSKSLDSSYNGYIETYDSNNTRKVIRYPVYQGNVQNTPFVPDSLRGFGCL